MAVISGFGPAAQPSLQQPWQLPFNEMYTVLKDKQKAADEQQARSDEMLTTLGSIQNLLPKDLMTHQEKMNSIIQNEEALRNQVGGDLTRPEYKQGLRKLILSTATDPFYPIAMQNYATKEDQDKTRLAMMAAGNYQGAWNEKDTYNPDTYEGAVLADGTLNKLNPGQFHPNDTFVPDIMSMAKEIIPQEYAGYQFNEKTGFWENYEGKRLSQNEIAKVLWKNQPAWENTANFQWYKDKFQHLNPGATEDDFKNHLNDLFKGAADIYDVNNYGASPLSGQMDGNGSGRGSADEAKIKTFTGVPTTTTVDSHGYDSPEALDSFISNMKSLVAPGGNLDKDRIGLEQKLSQSLGTNVAVTPVFSPGNSADPTNVDRYTFEIKDANGNIIDENSKVYKDNFEYITRIKYKYEEAYNAIDRANEFKTYALNESGYDPNKTNKEVIKLTNESEVATAQQVLKEIEDLVNNRKLVYVPGKYEKTGAFEKTKYTPGKGDQMEKEDLEMANKYKEGKISGTEYSEFLYSRAQMYQDIIDKRGGYAYDYKKTASTIRDRKQKELSEKVKKLDPTYSKYLDIYKQSFTGGQYQAVQQGNSFGYDENAVKFVKSIQGQLVNALTETINNKDFRGVVAYNTDNTELNKSEYNALAEDIKTKLSNGEIENSFIGWRFDDGGDGLVVDLTYNGKRVEFRDIKGVDSYLANQGYADISILNLMDSAARSLKGNELSERTLPSNSPLVGDTRDFGFVGGVNGLPRESFKRLNVDTYVDGKKYAKGSYVYNGKYFENLYDLTNEYMYKNAQEEYTGLNMVDKLIKAEGSGTTAVNPNTQATGSGQITPIALEQYNKDFGQFVTQEDLKDPNINKQVMSGLLTRSYPNALKAKNAPVTELTLALSYYAGASTAASWYNNSDYKNFGYLTQKDVNNLKKISDNITNGATYLRNAGVLPALGQSVTIN